MGELRVCHIANDIGETSVPMDIALALNRHTEIEAGVLGWFQVEPFADEDRISVHDLRAPNNTLGIDRKTYIRFKQIIDDYDIIHVHSPHSGSIAKVIAWQENIPVISTEQNNHKGFTRKGLIVNGLTNPLTEQVTCVSESVKRSLRWWERILLDHDPEVIYNGVNTTRLSQTNCDKFDLLSEFEINNKAITVAIAGALTKQKGYDILLPAIAEANNRLNESVELIAAGEGYLRQDLTSLAENLGISNKVHFVGEIPRTQVYCLMKATDIYTMPSRWEGFSVAAAEAVAAGSACVFSDIPEFTEAYNEVAMFHQVNDSTSLAMAITRLAEHGDLREDLSQAAKRVGKRFSLENIAKEYEKLYEVVKKT